MQYDVQWFCFLAVDRGVITPAICATLIVELGRDVDLLTFAQAVIDHDHCQNLETVQILANEAYERARLREPIPERGPDSVMAEQDGDDDVALIATHTAKSSRIAAHQYSVVMNHAGKSIGDLNLLASLPQDEAIAVLRALLKALRQAGASDLHLAAGAPPFMRIHGRIAMIGQEPLAAVAARELNTMLLSEAQRRRFASEHDLSFAMDIAPDLRVRVNLTVHRQGLAGTYHFVPHRIPSLDELGFADPEIIHRLLDNRNGMIVIAGPVGCGKTTTLAALVDSLNRERAQHIIKVEDPIEILHPSRRALVNQREIGTHTASCVSALKGALREDPDIIVIGEMHDLETTELAMTAAETGHLVLTTLHTRDAATTLGRMLDVFPPNQRPQIRAMASGSLRGIICQQLLARRDCDGRVLAYEILLNTAGLSRIIREGNMHMLPTVMQTGLAQGMMSMDRCVFDLFAKDLISATVAADALRSKDARQRLRTMIRARPGKASDETVATA